MRVDFGKWNTAVNLHPQKSTHFAHVTQPVITCSDCDDDCVKVVEYLMWIR